MKINALTFRWGGVNATNDATFRLFDLKSNLMFLLRKIKEYCYSFVVTNKSLCHPEFSSGSQGYEMLPHGGQAHKAHTSPVRFVKRVQHDNKLYLTFRKALAFTLAETLIVMGIIGVVAALTIPNLNKSTGDREKVAKLKKIYSNLEDAFGRATAVYGPIDEWFSNLPAGMDTTTRVGDRLTEFMKVSKNCGREKNKGCLNTTQKNMFDGGVTNPDNNTSYKFVLADGATVAITPLGIMYVDIDGANKGATQLGKDVFIFVYYFEDNGIIDALYVPRADNMAQYIGFLTPKSGQNDLNAGYATGWIIDYGNMDYLKLTSEGKCPNGRVPTDANPSCK